MTRLARLGTAVALLAAAAAVSAVSAPAVAASTCSGSGPCVIVQVLDAQGNIVGHRQFDHSDWQSTAQPSIVDNSIQDYQLRNPRGTILGDPQRDVASVRQLISMTPLDAGGDQPPDQVRYAYVLDGNGTAHPLTNQELGSAGANGFDGRLMPGFYELDGAIGYTRPLMADDDTDVNMNDRFLSGGALVVQAYTAGALLSLAAQINPTVVKAGVPASLTASAGGGTGPYSYVWSLAGGTRDGSSVTWSQPGTYYASVYARDSRQGYSPSRTVKVTVTCNPSTDPDHCGKKPPPPHGHHPGTGHEHGHHPPNGPDEGSGHHTSDGSRRHHSAGGDPQGRHRVGGTDGTHGTTTNDTASSHSDRAAGKERTRTTAGRAVTGRLLLAAQTYAVPQQQSAVAPVTTGAHVPPETHWSWQWKWAGVLVLPALVGLGMVGEGLQLRRRRARMGA